MSRRVLVGSLTLVVGVGLALGVACTANPTIDGSTVAKIGSPGAPPACKDLCARIEKLCGAAPQECVNADASGYCEQFWDDDNRLCRGQAATCQAATQCANAAAGDSGADAPDDAAKDDAGEAGPEAGTDASTDAKTD